MSEDVDADAIISDAAKEILRINLEIKELEERKSMLLSFFKSDKRFEKPGTYDLRDVQVSVTTNRRISQKKAQENLGEKVLGLISTPKVDARKARAYLTDVQLERIMDNYDHRIEVRPKRNEAL